MILDKFSELMARNEVHARRKVLAGIVMTTSPDLTQAKVITVTTGTKCVNGEYMSDSGGVVNDSHAEIIARRCLMEYFYSQLELHQSPCEYFFTFFFKRIFCYCFCKHHITRHARPINNVLLVLRTKLVSTSGNFATFPSET